MKQSMYEASQFCGRHAPFIWRKRHTVSNFMQRRSECGEGGGSRGLRTTYHRERDDAVPASQPAPARIVNADAIVNADDASVFLVVACQIVRKG